MINPLLDAWNCTPTVCALGSFGSNDPVGVPFCQMLHGHVGPAVGITAFDGADAGPGPIALVADTVNV